MAGSLVDRPLFTILHVYIARRLTMPELTGMLLLVVVLALLFDFSNGWHDSANAIATVVSTRVISPFVAVIVAGVLNVAGAFMSTAVAKMVGSGIVDPAGVTQHMVAAALAGAICWNLFTLLLGLPTSSSHALIGGTGGGGRDARRMGTVKLPACDRCSKPWCSRRFSALRWA